MRISDWSSDVCSSDLVKGFEEPVAVDGTGGKNGPETERAPLAIAQHMFKTLRGSNNLVFPNSRREVERYTHLLNEFCDRADRRSVVSGKSVSVRVDLGGRRIITKKKQQKQTI